MQLDALFEFGPVNLALKKQPHLLAVETLNQDDMPGPSLKVANNEAA